MISVTIDFDSKNPKELEKVEELTEVIKEIFEEKKDDGIKLEVEKVEMTEEGLKVQGYYKDLGEHIDNITKPEEKKDESRFAGFSKVELGIFDIALSTSDEQLAEVRKLAVLPESVVEKMRDNVTKLRREVSDEKINRD